MALLPRENEIEVDNSNGSNKASSFKCIPIYVIGEPGAKNVHYVWSKRPDLGELELFF